MPSKRELLLRRVVSALKAAPQPAALQDVHRQPYRPLERETLDAIAVYLADNPMLGLTETVERMDMDEGVERTVNFTLEFRVSDDVPDAAIDDLYVWAVKRVLTDPGIRELVFDLEERTSRGFQQADVGKPVGRAETHFLATLHTAETDPTAEDIYDA